MTTFIALFVLFIAIAGGGSMWFFFVRSLKVNDRDDKK